jgi:hypothetical protein
VNKNYPVIMADIYRKPSNLTKDRTENESINKKRLAKLLYDSPINPISYHALNAKIYLLSS